MATPLSHLAVPLTLVLILGPDSVPPELMVLAFVCAVLPDIDTLGLWLGIPYDHPFGHRGFTHSIPFSALLAAAGALLGPWADVSASTSFLVLFVSAASHGMLDAMTNGGLGIAFFSPFSNRRGFLPWRVIEVSPLRPSELFSWHGLRVLGSEVRWVWLPCGVVALVGMAWRQG